MKLSRKSCVAGAAMALVLAAAATGCASDSRAAAALPTLALTSSSANAPARTSALTTHTKDSSKARPTAVAGSNYTIADYIRDQGITENSQHPGDAGAPTVVLPALGEGWRDAGTDAPGFAYGLIVYDGPGTTSDKPSILTLLSKLDGNVDPQRLIDYAPNELRNLPGFESGGGERPATLAGFAAYQIGGEFIDNGETRLVAQKTVVLPGSDGVYVLQINVDAPADQGGVVEAATAAIDAGTTIDAS